MALRLIEVYIPSDSEQTLREMLGDKKILGIWRNGISEGTTHLSIMAWSEDAGEILDILEKRFSPFEQFRIIVLPVEAIVPRPETSDEKTKEEVASQK